MTPADNSIAIDIQQLSKNFGKVNAVDGISFQIRRGEIFSLLGTNGAGKTTTIKMLCCLLTPSKGNAQVMGNSITDHPEKIKKIIGVSPQETAIATHLSPQENLALIGGVFKLSKDLIKKRSAELIDLMELTERKGSQSRKLSGGMQRRLSIAMALMSDPEIVFLDEPTIGLDPHARKSVWNYIEKLKGEKTILLTTHYLEEADALADHIAIMKAGKIIDEGTSFELKKRFRKGQSLHITTDIIIPEVLEGLKAKNLMVRNDNTNLFIEADELDIYDIMDYLRSKKLKIEGLQLREPTLDEVFIELTERGGES
ncbi:MAG: ATP-binding cassette domain-containing protein [Bacteroidales bacterium]|nr:ATP-binding cassette domain-containing protein [Bacteroidales bacterium]